MPGAAALFGSTVPAAEQALETLLDSHLVEPGCWAGRYRFHVVVDGTAHDIRGWSVAVANSQAYGGGMYVAPDAKLDDGEFDVVMGSESSKLTFLRDISKVFDGSHSKLPYVHTVRGRKIEISTDRPFDIYADGDPIGRTPATVTSGAPTRSMASRTPCSSLTSRLATSRPNVAWYDATARSRSRQAMPT